MAKHTLIDTVDNKQLLANRAERDLHGRIIPDTYATYDYVNKRSYSDFEKGYFGHILLDETGTPVLDETGKYIYNEDSAELWSKFREVGFGAERAIADENGNNIAETYATKADVETVMGDIETLLAAL